MNPMIYIDPLGLVPVKTCAERILKAAEKNKKSKKIFIRLDFWLWVENK